jgi:adenylate cyclase
MTRPPGERLLRGLGFGVGAGLIALLLGLAGLARTAEMKLYDWRTRAAASARRAAPSADIVLVNIDDDSLRRMEPLVGRWPWPRLVHATLIDYLAAGGAKAVLYDVLFAEADRSKFMVGEAEWTGEESDQALVDATERAGNVVHVAEAASAELLDPSRAVNAALHDVPGLNRPFSVEPCVERRPQITPPFPALARAARAIGHSLVVYDPDGPLRRVVPFVRIARQADGRPGEAPAEAGAARDPLSATEIVVPSLSLAAMMMADGLAPEDVGVSDGVLAIGTTRVPLVTELVPDYYGPPTPACRALLPWRGPTRGSDGVPTFPYYSFYDLFYSRQQVLENVRPEVPPDTFRGKIVVVGVAAEGLRDVFVTPFAEGRMPGAEIHANTIDAWRTGRALVPLSGWRGALVAIGLAMLVGGAGAFRSAWITAAAASVLAAGYLWLNIRQFAAGSWWPLALPLTAMLMAFVADLGWQYFVEGREKRKVKQLFSRYVARNVYDQLLADPTRAQLGGTRRYMTVLFSDMRGFTSLSEKGRPEEIVSQLNDYFTRMVKVLFEHQGTLDKFVGDMVMALFGAPLDDEDHAEHAVQTALAMVRALDVLNAEWEAFGQPRLDIGIGINSGEMVAGNIGSDTIMSYTVIGDAVNLGARLESLNKEYGTRIIISESTRALLKGQYDIRPLGSVTVKGKSQPVAIFQVRPS